MKNEGIKGRKRISITVLVLVATIILIVGVLQLVFYHISDQITEALLTPFMDNPDVPFKDQKRGVYWLDESKGELNAILYTDARITSVAPLKSSYPSRSQWLVEGREFQAHGLTFRLIRGQPPTARRQPGTSRYDWHWQPEQFLCEYPPGAWQEISREWEALVGERLERP